VDRQNLAQTACSGPAQPHTIEVSHPMINPLTSADPPTLKTANHATEDQGSTVNIHGHYIHTRKWIFQANRLTKHGKRTLGSSPTNIHPFGFHAHLFNIRVWGHLANSQTSSVEKLISLTELQEEA